MIDQLVCDMNTKDSQVAKKMIALKVLKDILRMYPSGSKLYKLPCQLPSKLSSWMIFLHDPN